MRICKVVHVNRTRTHHVEMGQVNRQRMHYILERTHYMEMAEQEARSEERRAMTRLRVQRFRNRRALDEAAARPQETHKQKKWLASYIFLTVSYIAMPVLASMSQQGCRRLTSRRNG